MARRVVLNPAGIDDAYLRGLQASFPGWGGRATFDWWYRRETGAPPADLVGVFEDDVLVAGMAVVYRRFDARVCAGSGAQHGEVVAITSGAWTLASHRRRGCFAALLESAREAAAARRAAALLGFTSAGRASTRTLAATADVVLESWNIRHARAAATRRTRGPAAPAPGPEELRRWFHEHRGGAGFVYPTTDEFAEQARLRRRGSTVVNACDGYWAILERDHVHAVVHEARPLEAAGMTAALARVARDRGELEAYTMVPEVAELAARANFAVRPARVFVLAVPGGDSARLGPAPWWVQSLDRA